MRSSHFAPDDKGFWGCVETWAFVALQANSRFLFACGYSE